MGPRHHVAVVGAGAMGAAAAWQLMRRGHAVTVFEQYALGHDRGSSHGDARIHRLAHVDPWWTQLARTARGAWDDLQEESGQALVRTVGGLDHGHPGLVAEVAASCGRAGIDHSWMDPAAVSERWPGIRSDHAVLFHPDAGTTDAAATVRTLLARARDRGADVRDHTPVDRVAVVGTRVELRPRGGVSQVFDRVVVTAGAWTAELMDDLASLPALHVTREHPVEFTGTGDAEPGNWPTVIHHDTGRTTAAGTANTIRSYAVPTTSGRLKVGEHHAGPAVVPGSHALPDPDAVRRVRDYVQDWLPGLDPSSADPATCLYTSTTTTDFIIDRVGPVAVAAGFSGHGFKYVPWVGAVLADLVEDRTGPRRFRLPGQPSRT